MRLTQRASAPLSLSVRPSIEILCRIAARPPLQTSEWKGGRQLVITPGVSLSLTPNCAAGPFWQQHSTPQIMAFDFFLGWITLELIFVP